MKEYTFKNVLFNDGHIGAHRFTVKHKLERHRHNFIELIYIVSGTGVQEIDSVSYNVKRGDFLFVNLGKSHTCYPDPGKELSYIEVMFDMEFISKELINKSNAFDILSLSSFQDFNLSIDENAEPMVTFLGEERLAVEHILADLVTEITEKKALYKNVIHGYVETLFSKLIRKLNEDEEEALYQKQDTMAKLLEYINENFKEDFTLEALAEKCFYNSSYFSRMFKERFGMGYKSYITKLRSDKAAELLVGSTLPIKEIMLRCGFKDKNAFYRSVQKWYGKTPSEIRKRK